MSISTCCLKGFEWDGTSTGRIDKLTDAFVDIDVYIAGSNPDVAVLLIHDLLGWTFPNVRLLADHYAREVNVTVYVPDFFDGEVLPVDPIIQGKWHEVDLKGFMQRNGRDIREKMIFDVARVIRGKYKKVGAVGFCYGGWAVFRLGAKEHQPPLVDCVSAGHPSLLTKKDISEISVPIQLLVPELDPVFTDDMKIYSFETLLKRTVPFDYQYFPGVEHACLVRGDPEKSGEREAMVRGKDAVINWLRQNLHAV